MKSLIKKVLEQFQPTWWLEITTASPRCDYYFGPFDSESEAIQAQPGHEADLKSEGGELQRVSVVRRIPPAQLTVEYPDAA